MYVNIKELPLCVQVELSNQQYCKKDIEVSTATELDLSIAGGHGVRGFVVIINLVTGESSISQGSWGGSNLFCPTNAVDNDTGLHVLPVNGAVIKGTSGYGGTFATVYINPDNLAKLLPSEDTVTPRQAKILSIYKGYKAAYRKEQLFDTWYVKDNFKDGPVKQIEIDDLVSAGYLKQNKVGSTTITTEGKNSAKGGYEPV